MSEKIILFRYLQKVQWMNRRYFLELIKKQSIELNWKIIENINQEIKIWDEIKIQLWKDKIHQEKIEKFPIFRPVMVLFNKPKWFVVSKDDKHNKTIYELLPESWKKDFYYIWRLDKDSHWLLLLTNDPKLVDKYENPKNDIFKIYEVKINWMYKKRDSLKLMKWIPVNEDGKLMTVSDIEEKVAFDYLRFHSLTTLDTKNNQTLLKIILKEWKKRHIRRALSALWYKVLDLKRTRFWKYQLWTIKLWKYMISKILE